MEGNAYSFLFAVRSAVRVVEDVDGKLEEDGKNSTQSAKFGEHGDDSSNYLIDILQCAHVMHYCSSHLRQKQNYVTRDNNFQSNRLWLPICFEKN